MGAMGRMYAQYLSSAGWRKRKHVFPSKTTHTNHSLLLHRINVCDLPSKYADLQRDFAATPNVTPLLDGHAVSRSSDFIIYSVEAEFIDRVVQDYGPCKFLLFMAHIKSPFVLSPGYSNETSCDSSRPDFRQGSRKGGIREVSSFRYTHRVLSFFAWSRSQPDWAAFGEHFPHDHNCPKRSSVGRHLTNFISGPHQTPCLKRSSCPCRVYPSVPAITICLPLL